MQNGQSEKIERIKYLADLLNRAAKAYYAEDREIMSNQEYDALYDELQELEQETGFLPAGSPTVRVGYEAVDELPKEKHEAPLLSLVKTARLAPTMPGHLKIFPWQFPLPGIWCFGGRQ